jgi:hypothetical protein
MLSIDTTTERIESKGGLILAGKLAQFMGIKNIVSPVLKNSGTVLTQLFAALVQGESDFEAERPFRDSELVHHAFGLDTALAADTVRIYSGDMTERPELVAGLAWQIQDCSLRLLSRASFTPIATKRKEYIPCDIDTSPMNNEGTKKENIGWTYKGYEGYHPIFAYLGAEGYMLSCELRPGSQHCQKGTPEFLKGVVKGLPGGMKGKKILFRLDSGNDAMETVRALLGEGDKEAQKAYKEGRNIIIKRNLRGESKEIWLDLAKEYGRGEQEREGKMRYTGKVKLDCAINNRYPSLDVVFEVIERTIDRTGQPFILPEIEVNTFWSNVGEKAETVIQLYHDHGTMEQFHSELKTDMNLEKFPSGKYGVNQIMLLMGMCAYNTLRYIGQGMLGEKELLPVKPREGTVRKRLIHVIRYIIQLAGKLVHHGGKVIFKIYEKNEWLAVFLKLHTAFQELR